MCNAKVVQIDPSQRWGEGPTKMIFLVRKGYVFACRVIVPSSVAVLKGIFTFFFITRQSEISITSHDTPPVTCSASPLMSAKCF